MSPTKRLTVVTGAGSSRAYGFPLGRDLLELICTSPPLDGPYIHSQKVAAANAQQHADFQRQVRGAGLPSIDELLKHKEGQQTFFDWCRAQIAANILRAEAHCDVHSRGHTDDWLRAIWSRLSRKTLDDALFHVRFMTFNYDRLIEHFLSSGIRHVYDTDQTRAQEALQVRGGVLHLHGTMGQYDAACSDFTRGICGWGHALDSATCPHVAKHLRLFWQNADAHTEEMAVERLADSDEILVLGVGAASDALFRLLAKAARIRSHGGARPRVLFRALSLSPIDTEKIQDKLSGLNYEADVAEGNCSSAIQLVDWDRYF